MDIKNKLLAYGKKSITLEALTDLLKADLADTKGFKKPIFLLWRFNFGTSKELRPERKS